MIIELVEYTNKFAEYSDGNSRHTLKLLDNFARHLFPWRRLFPAFRESQACAHRIEQEIFWIATNLITPRALFSPVFLQSFSVIHERGSDNSFQRYGHSEFSQMAASRHLGFGETGNNAIRSAVPENLSLGSNRKLIG